MAYIRVRLKIAADQRKKRFIEILNIFFAMRTGRNRKCENANSTINWTKANSLYPFLPSAIISFEPLKRKIQRKILVI